MNRSQKLTRRVAETVVPVDALAAVQTSLDMEGANAAKFNTDPEMLHFRDGDQVKVRNAKADPIFMLSQQGWHHVPEDDGSFPAPLASPLSGGGSMVAVLSKSWSGKEFKVRAVATKNPDNDEWDTVFTEV